MLRLWPETLYAGLFAGHGWLSSGTRAGNAAEAAGGNDAEALTAQLADLLAQLPANGSRRRSLRLLVSDSLAQVVMLPWQAELLRQPELEAYAYACYERSGVLLNEQWTMHAEFKQFGRAGLAYALPSGWLASVAAVCAAHHVRLRSVLPVSAAAYWKAPRQLGSKDGWLLLSEAHRVSGLVYQNGTLVQIDVQPVTADGDGAGARLLRRLSARHTRPACVCHWTPVPLATAAPAYIGAYLPDTTIVQITRGNWQ